METNDPQQTEEPQGDAGVVTKKQYDAGVDYVKNTVSPSYAEAKAAFGVDGAKALEENWSDSYHYYQWTDEERTVLLTFTVEGGAETCISYTGDV